MRLFTVQGKDDGRRLDRFAMSVMPGAGAGQIQKLIRLKEIKINGRPGKADAHVNKGDEVRIFAPEELFVKRSAPDPFLSRFVPHIRAAYEDDNILVVDKKPGLVVHPDEKEKVDTLVNHVRAYLYQKGAYDPEEGFAPSPCNRIDRFTGGLVIVAKTQEALWEMDAAIREHRVDKEYLLACRGMLRNDKGRMTGYMVHEDKHMRVLDRSLPGAQKAELTYETLYRAGGLSLVTCRLLTGRTHQIRAQFAHAGHPLVGDGQYGDAHREQSGPMSYQALYSWRLTFHFSGGPLAYLDGKCVTGSVPPFAGRLFPGYQGGSGHEG